MRGLVWRVARQVARWGACHVARRVRVCCRLGGRFLVTTTTHDPYQMMGFCKGGDQNPCDPYQII